MEKSASDVPNAYYSQNSFNLISAYLGSEAAFELALGAERDLPDSYWMLVRRKRQYSMLNVPKTVADMDTGLKMVVGDAQC